MNNAYLYPLYVQVTPWEILAIKGTLSLIKSLNLNYVQVVHSGDMAGLNLKKQFQQQASSEKICVSIWHELVSAAHVAQKLKEPADSRAAVLLISAEHSRSLIAALKAEGIMDLLLIGGVQWGDNIAVVQGLNRTAQGAFTIAYDSNPATQYMRKLSNETLISTHVNPWFREWYETLFQCRSNDESLHDYHKRCSSDRRALATSPEFTASKYLSTTQNALAAVIQEAGKVVQSTCGQRIACNLFWQKHVSSEIFIALNKKTYEINNTLGDAMSLHDGAAFGRYKIYNYDALKYNLVGSSLENGSTITFNVNLNGAQYPQNREPLAQCTNSISCPGCTALSKTPDFLYIPGDIIIGIMINTHKSKGVFACKDIKLENGVQYSLVASAAIEYINSELRTSVKLNGKVKVGALILSSCSSATMASNLVISIHYGRLTLKDHGGKVIPASKIKAWVSFGDSVTTAMASSVKSFGLPLISPTASADSLIGMGVFRTIGSNSRQIEPIFRMVDLLKFKCLQVVNSNDMTQRELSRLFRQLANTKGICVSQCLEVNTDGTIATIAATLKLNERSSGVVVAFLTNAIEINELLKSTADSGLIFIGSNFWGANRRNVIKNVTNSAGQNAIVLSTHDVKVPFYDQMVTSLRPTSSSATNNPWFKEYYETLFNCSLQGSVLLTNRCNDTFPLGSANGYKAEQNTAPTVDAIFAIAMAFDGVLKDLCQTNYSSMYTCELSNCTFIHLLLYYFQPFVTNFGAIRD